MQIVLYFRFSSKVIFDTTVSASSGLPFCKEKLDDYNPNYELKSFVLCVVVVLFKEYDTFNDKS